VTNLCRHRHGGKFSSRILIKFSAFPHETAQFEFGDDSHLILRLSNEVPRALIPLPSSSSSPPPPWLAMKSHRTSSLHLKTDSKVRRTCLLRSYGYPTIKIVWLIRRLSDFWYCREMKNTRAHISWSRHPVTFGTTIVPDALSIARARFADVRIRYDSRVAAH